MRHTYHVHGMTCNNCRNHVEETLSKVEGVSKVIELKAKSNPKWKSNKPDPATSKVPWKIFNIGNSNDNSSYR